jgi:hypothetical protein
MGFIYMEQACILAGRPLYSHAVPNTFPKGRREGQSSTWVYRTVWGLQEPTLNEWPQPIREHLKLSTVISAIDWDLIQFGRRE